MKTIQPKCKNCQQLNKKLRILKSDYDFEVKKLAEDLSAEKALYEISMQKDIKKVNDKYQQEKLLHEQANKKWMEKYDQTVKSTQQQIQQLQNQKDKQIQQISNHWNIKYLEFKKNHQAQLTLTVEKMQSSFNIKLQQQKKKYQEQKIKTKEFNQKTIFDLQIAHQRQIQRSKKEYQCMIVGLKCEKKTSEALHMANKKQNEQKQIKLYQELYLCKKHIAQLQGEIQELKMSIFDKDNIIQQFKDKIQKLKIQHQENTQILKKQYKNNIQQINSKYKNDLKEFYKELEKQNQKYTISLKKIQQNVQIERKIYKQNMEEVKVSLQERPSKQQDTEQIIYLRQIVEKKNREIMMLLQELKWYRLELENKQETYNRIFVSIGNNSINNQNLNKKKEFKLRRAGRSVTTVREAAGGNIILDENKKIKINSKIL